MMILPEDLEEQFKEELNRYQEATQMPFISRIELRAKQEGIEQGSLQTLRENAIAILETRFDMVPSEVIEAINSIEDKSLLQQLLREAIAIGSVAEFQQVLAQAKAES